MLIKYVINDMNFVVNSFQEFLLLKAMIFYDANNCHNANECLRRIALTINMFMVWVVVFPVNNIVLCSNAQISDVLQRSISDVDCSLHAVSNCFNNSFITKPVLSLSTTFHCILKIPLSKLSHCYFSCLFSIHPYSLEDALDEFWF